MLAQRTPVVKKGEGGPASPAVLSASPTAPSPPPPTASLQSFDEAKKWLSQQVSKQNQVLLQAKAGISSASSSTAVRDQAQRDEQLRYQRQREELDRLHHEEQEKERAHGRAVLERQQEEKKTA